MGKRGDKKRRQAKQRRPRSTQVTVLEIGPFRMEQHGRNILQHVDHDHPQYAEWMRMREEIAAKLPSEIEGLRAEIQKDLAPFDAFDVVTDLWLGNLPKDRETYTESSEEGLLAVAELAAALLISRAHRLGESPGEWFGRHAYEVNGKLRSLLQLEQMRIVAQQVAGGGSEYEAIRGRARAHHMIVRGTSYSWQEEATTRELCGTGAIGADLARALGFSVDDAFGLAESVTAVGLERIEARIDHARDFVATVQMYTERARRGADLATIPEGYRRVVELLTPLGKAAAAQQARMMGVGWASYASGTTMSFRTEELASHAGTSTAATEAFLTRFSTQFGYRPGSSRPVSIDDLRFKPILDDGDGNYLCAAPHNLLWAIRPAFESVANEAGGSLWKRYETHRRRMVEGRATAALVRATGADWSHTGVHYEIVEDGQAKRPELDGIARVDTAAFIVEAKASSMRPGARRGAPESLREWLEREIGTAGTQLRRARDSLFSGASGKPSELCDKDGQRVDADLSGIWHVIELVIVLEDLPGIAPATWRLADAGFLPNEDPPIVISLHELEIICEIVSRPCELVHYFLRRQRMNRQRRATATDELDFFMHYLKDGLYWDDSSDEDMPTPASAPVNLLSFTDPLDAYYMYTRGERSTPASKPERRHHRDVARVLDLLDSSSQSGHLSIALALLDLDRKPRERVVGDMRRLKKLSATQNRTRDRSYYGDYMGVTVMAVPASEARDLPGMLQTYCQLKKHQLKLETWAGFGVFDGPPELFQVAGVVSGPWEPDEDLDRLVRTLPSYGHETERFDGMAIERSQTADSSEDRRSA